jgi:hypothetical protein
MMKAASVKFGTLCVAQGPLLANLQGFAPLNTDRPGFFVGFTPLGRRERLQPSPAKKQN